MNDGYREVIAAADRDRLNLLLSTAGRMGTPVQNVEKDFWDTVIILHGTRRWHERRGSLRHGGHRVSRHYFDVYRLLQSPRGPAMRANVGLAIDCARHARMFFNSADLDLDDAVAGRLVPAPTPEMLAVLRRDYEAMSGMIFGPVPPFEDVVSAIEQLQVEVTETLGGSAV